MGTDELIWKLYMVPQQCWRDLPWLKGNGWRWFAGQLCGFLLEYGDLAHWGAWPSNYQRTQFVFELSDNFQWGKDGDIWGIAIIKNFSSKNLWWSDGKFCTYNLPLRWIQCIHPCNEELAEIYVSMVYFPLMQMFYLHSDAYGCKILFPRFIGPPVMHEINKFEDKK